MKEMWLLLRSMVLVSVLAGGVLAGQARPWSAEASEIEDALRNGELVSREELGRGANRPHKLTLARGERRVEGLWKPIERGKKEWAWESFQAEIAAYEVDQMLGLGMVPPTVIRELDGVAGSLQLWVSGCRLYEEAEGEAPKDPERWDRETAQMKLFDNLISNWDRTGRNFMIDSDWSIVLIDHSQAFLSTRELSPHPEQLPDRFDRRLVAALRSLEPTYLRFKFGRLLMEPQIEAILARRDALLVRMEKLIAENGEEAVVF